jgi:hypothetical protein
MPKQKTNKLLKSVQELLLERQSLAHKERAVLGSLNSMLNQLGYQIVGHDGKPALKRRGRPPKAKLSKS